MADKGEERAGWHHKASWPDSPVSLPENDRAVFYGPDPVGSVYKINGVPEEVSWSWNGSWIGPSSGVTDTFESALTNIRNAYIEMIHNEPHLTNDINGRKRLLPPFADGST